MRMMAASVLFAVSLGFAQAEPLPWPSTDYAGTFEVLGAGNRMVAVSVRYQSETRRAAVSGKIRGFGVRGVVDVESRKMRIVTDVMPERVFAVDLPKDKLDTVGTPTEETREVEGEACTVWTVGEAKVCFDEDGIWRQIVRGDTTIVLTGLERGPQPDSAFEIGEASGGKLPLLMRRIEFDGLNPFPFLK